MQHSVTHFSHSVLFENRHAFRWQIDINVSPDTLAVSLVFAIAAALLAGLYPAIRAGQSPPAIAMREE